VGSLSVKMDSIYFETDTGISEKLKASDNMLTIPLNYTVVCEDPDAKI